MARILVVDDVKVVRMMVADVLAMHGHFPIPVESGDLVLDMLDELTKFGFRDSFPDLAVVDHHMPGISGADLIRELRRRGHRFPIIALTGAPGGDEAMREAGAEVVLRKPFHEGPLIAAVRSQLER